MASLEVFREVFGVEVARDDALREVLRPKRLAMSHGPRHVGWPIEADNRPAAALKGSSSHALRTLDQTFAVSEM